MAYIRKNACTALKRLMHATGRPYETATLVSWHDFEDYPVRVFIWRDPIDRILSGYLNKFVQQVRHGDVFDSYAHVTGLDPQRASFEDFVTRYLILPDTEIDPHFRSQYCYLGAVKYTHAIHIEQLRERMEPLIGRVLAEHAFGERCNFTQGLPDAGFRDARRMRAEALHAAVASKGALPSRSSLLTPFLVDVLEERYADDRAMVDELRQG